MNSNFTICSFDNKNNKNENTKITGTLKRKYTGKMYKIFYTEDQYINVTADHILKVKNLDTNEIIEISAEELCKNYSKYLLVADN